MTGIEFEKQVVKLLRSQGYRNLKLTEKYDYGVDITATKDGVRWGIQVKRNSNLVKAIAVRQVVTALNKYNCDRAMVVTNNVFSNVAKELAKSNNCLLIDRSKLINWTEIDKT
jgi:HJR/Mrr/RecB family endonuclease